MNDIKLKPLIITFVIIFVASFAVFMLAAPKSEVETQPDTSVAKSNGTVTDEDFAKEQADKAAKEAEEAQKAAAEESQKAAEAAAQAAAQEAAKNGSSSGSGSYIPPASYPVASAAQIKDATIKCMLFTISSMMNGNYEGYYQNGRGDHYQQARSHCDAAKNSDGNDKFTADSIRIYETRKGETIQGSALPQWWDTILANEPDLM
jgi:hypothetical protein